MIALLNLFDLKNPPGFYSLFDGPYKVYLVLIIL